MGFLKKNDKLNTMPHGIGVRSLKPDGITEFNDILIPKGAALPACERRTYRLPRTDFHSFFLNVLKGDHERISSSEEICSLNIPLPESIKGGENLVITISVDTLLFLLIKITMPDKSLELTISCEKSDLSFSVNVGKWTSILTASKKVILKGNPDVPSSGTMLDDHIYNENQSFPAGCSVVDGIVGMKEVLECLNSFKNRQRVAEGMPMSKEHGHCFMIYGAPGIGTTTAAQLVTRFLYEMDFLVNAVPIKVSSKDLYRDVSQKMVAFIKKLMENAFNSALIIDNFQELYNGGNLGPANRVMDAIIEAYSSVENKPYLIVAGYQPELKKMMDRNLRFSRLFVENEIVLEGYTLDEYVQLLHILAKKRGYVIDDYADCELKKHIKAARDLPEFKHIYYLADHMIAPAITNAANALVSAGKPADSANARILRLEDFGLSSNTSVLSDLLLELDHLTGLSAVKKQVHELVAIQEVRLQAEKEGYPFPDSPISNHMIFLGHAGTGKTTVARIIAQIYKELGLLSKGHLIEVTRKDLIGEYQGQTARLVAQKVNESIGGVLFIDEAYSLCRNDKDSYGQEAIDTLVPLLENFRTQFICIMAGYTHDMDVFLAKNEGLASRFPHKIIFEDYTCDEMLEIFKHFLLKDGYAIEPAALAKVKELIKDKGRLVDFGNARGVRNIYETIITNHLIRLNQSSNWSAAEQLLICAADVNYDGFSENTESLDEVLIKFDKYIGLTEIKMQVIELISSIRADAMRAQRGVTRSNPRTLHMVFTGNPGTGKTTVARLMGEVYRALGLLPTSNVLEVSRTDLVASYVGQTSPKTTKIVEQALGGVLFIDEAYQLNRGGENDFGKEAIDTLVPLLENHRSDFVCIIAGYTDEMDAFLSTNPGLKSRFPNIIHFKDYTLDELFEIFMQNIHSQGISLQPEAEALVIQLLEKESSEPDFGNARGVRNLVDRIVAHMDVRICKSTDTKSVAGAVDCTKIMCEDVY